MYSCRAYNVAAFVAAIVKNKLHRQSATLTEYKQKVVELQKRLIEVICHNR